ncbi:hypothetical protein KDW_04460 [Dictyobacter vulcani]|uniref:Uncharacterized protein n=1 Tax=Dictyobacter vulcani TaxID=2607529 RepID=A0A5J4KC09_9CHLR|nr:hypothetical protein KDW_04460 [Dictyobacter vulcani]
MNEVAKRGKPGASASKEEKKRAKKICHLYKSELHKCEYERNTLHIDPCLLVSALLRLARRQETFACTMRT